MKTIQNFSQNWLKRISFEQQHSAFTDLVNTKHGLLLCYRQATDHVSGDGVIVVLKTNYNGGVITRRRIRLEGVDLRDPKLSISPNGKIYLLAYARHADDENITTITQNVVWTSTNGDTWSSMHTIGIPYWWLWRIRWTTTQNDTAFGLAYNRRANRIDLYAGNPTRSFQKRQTGVLSLSKHGKGYPNESDISVDENGRLYALVRRDADSFTAQFGESLPPYRYWRWYDLNEYIGGPCWLQIDSNTWIVAGRAWTGTALVTRIWQLDASSKTLRVLDTLTSAGDNSYPGLALCGNTLYVSYYSSHQDQTSEIYLASYNIDIKGSK